MGQRIAVIDYGMGNLRSVSKAIEHVARPEDQVVVTDETSLILSSDRVVFPGQGAARDCMVAIGTHHVRQAILEAARSKPFLGICMGLQVLMEHSEENQGTELLGVYPGRVRRFASDMPGQGGMALKIPHMGWNRVRPTHPHPLWEGIEPGARFYFVHSYYVDPEDASLPATTTDYGIEFTSAIAQANVFAVQFHPEKSAEAGLRLLRNFVSWVPDC
jgi:glutamine amidotransferase